MTLTEERAHLINQMQTEKNPKQLEILRSQLNQVEGALRNQQQKNYWYESYR